MKKKRKRNGEYYKNEGDFHSLLTCQKLIRYWWIGLLIKVKLLWQGLYFGELWVFNFMRLNIIIFKPMTQHCFTTFTFQHIPLKLYNIFWILIKHLSLELHTPILHKVNIRYRKWTCVIHRTLLVYFCTLAKGCWRPTREQTSANDARCQPIPLAGLKRRRQDF